MVPRSLGARSRTAQGREMGGRVWREDASSSGVCKDGEEDLEKYPAVSISKNKLKYAHLV